MRNRCAVFSLRSANMFHEIRIMDIRWLPGRQQPHTVAIYANRNENENNLKFLFFHYLPLPHRSILSIVHALPRSNFVQSKIWWEKVYMQPCVFHVCTAIIAICHSISSKWTHTLTRKQIEIGRVVVVAAHAEPIDLICPRESLYRNHEVLEMQK